MAAPDPLVTASRNAARVLRATMPLTAMPSTRIDLERAARELDEALAKRPTLITADVKGDLL